MIIIGPFIIIVNNYGVNQDEPPPEHQPPERRLIERPKPPEQDTTNMIYVTCDTPGCEWDGHYDTSGKAAQGLGAHKSWCVKGKLFKKHPFGRTS